MAWPAPRTWVAGELVTAALLNTYLRDSLAYLKDAPSFAGPITIGASVLGDATNGIYIAKGLHVGGTSDPGDNNLLVDGVLTTNGFGTHTFGAGGTGIGDVNLNLNGGSTSGHGSYISFSRNSTSTSFIGHDSYINGTASNALNIYAPTSDGLMLSAANASGTIGFYTGATPTLRTTIDSGGAINHAGLFFTSGGGASSNYQLEALSVGHDAAAHTSWIQSGGAAAASKLEINPVGGGVRMAFGAGAATFDANGNISSVSDERMKDRISPLAYGLAEVLALNPIQYGYNATSGLDREHLYGGFSAQNVQAVMPLAVGMDRHGYLTLADRPIAGALVNAMKTLDSRIAQLEATISAISAERN